VQYARALGCDPVVFSHTEAKREDALNLGAKEFYMIPASPQEKLDLKEGVHVLLLCGEGLPNFEQSVQKTPHYSKTNWSQDSCPHLLDEPPSCL